MAYPTTLSVRFIGFCLALAAIGTAPAAALEPDQIVLIVNSNVPAGRKLAEFYAQGRHIPKNRIIELSLAVPNPATFPEEISPAEFDAKVIPVVREFLTKNELDKTVTCLVPVWGVPLRVGRRSLNEADKKELADLKTQFADLKGKIETQVVAAEALAATVDSSFKPATASDLDSLVHRGEAALNAVLKQLPNMKDPEKRGDAYGKMMSLVREIAGQPAIAAKLSDPDFWPLAPKKPLPDDILAERAHTADVQKKLNALQLEPPGAANRARVRELFKAELGSFNTARIFVAQIRNADDAESEAAFDSELALLWWPLYPKARWQLNPLNWHYAGRVRLPGHTLMVTRLDGPTERSVHDLIETSLNVEARGLKGEIVLDARGKPPTEPYGVYDQTIRNLAELLKSKTSLSVVLDDKEALIAEHSQKDIAVYCGWYRLRHYVSPGNFNAGAVAFHVASLEMVSLHNPDETGWCHNLMDAGVVATLGPVAEPYLQSFPPADEFFPLLLTGKLPLADVYWKTTPWTSWMQCCVGDPLYTPYKMNPPLSKADLPESLKALVP